MRSHRDILGLWPSLAELYRDLIAAGHDISQNGVARWWQRNNIPAEWFAAVCAAAKARELDSVSIELLVALIGAPDETPNRIKRRRPRGVAQRGAV